MKMRFLRPSLAWHSTLGSPCISAAGLRTWSERSCLFPVLLPAPSPLFPPGVGDLSRPWAMGKSPHLTFALSS